MLPGLCPGAPELFDSKKCTSHFDNVQRGELMRFGQQLVVDARAVAASEVFNPPNAVVPKYTSVRG